MSTHPKYREDGNRYAIHDRQAQSAYLLFADASVYVHGAAPAPDGAGAAGLSVRFSGGLAAEAFGAAVSGASGVFGAAIALFLCRGGGTKGWPPLFQL